MIIKLSKAEQKTLSALDPKQSGPKPWQSAREVGGGVFRKKPENLTQEEIRVVRNAFRKLVRETLVEMNATDRGKYRIHDRGRKLLVAGATEFEGRFDRGEATKAAKAAGEARLKSRPKPKKAAAKAKPKKAATKKATKAKPKKQVAKPKKATTKKTPKKPAAKPAAKKAAKAKTSKKPTTKAKVEVVDKTKDAESAKTAKGTNGTGNGERKKPKFKRRQALKYANSQASEE